MASSDREGVFEMTTDVDSPWWAKDVEAVVRPETRKMLEEYAGVPPEKTIQHIEETVRHL